MNRSVRKAHRETVAVSPLRFAQPAPGVSCQPRHGIRHATRQWPTRQMAYSTYQAQQDQTHPGTLSLPYPHRNSKILPPWLITGAVASRIRSFGATPVPVGTIRPMTMPAVNPPAMGFLISQGVTNHPGGHYRKGRALGSQHVHGTTGGIIHCGAARRHGHGSHKRKEEASFHDTPWTRRGPGIFRKKPFLPVFQDSHPAFDSYLDCSKIHS